MLATSPDMLENIGEHVSMQIQCEGRVVSTQVWG